MSYMNFYRAVERSMRGAKEFSRPAVEAVAAVIGPRSAAAMMLADAAAHPGPVRFWRTRKGDFVLEKLDAPTTSPEKQTPEV